MHRHCEICGQPATDSDKANVARLRLEARVVALCTEHAEEVRQAGIESLDELRARYREADGQRARLPRRSPLDRRVFPPRPEGRRRNDGRRGIERDD